MKLLTKFQVSEGRGLSSKAPPLLPSKLALPLQIALLFNTLLALVYFPPLIASECTVILFSGYCAFYYR